ncbi:hypothetical protein AXG89_41615 (plasmid) [Burkholderia sp. PAMC 26561]|nr:hypothetical protein AXG89_41435 [Burkholderia sp. PAMC 26561]AMH42824.1 hypothetical protein AXG89_41615 [Burkholderia sp. PAMC 26561]
MVKPFEGYLRERVAAAAPDWIPAAVLWREIQSMGLLAAAELYANVVRRNSVNPETMFSREALIRVDIVKHTRNDLKPSIRVLKFKARP